MRVDNIMPYNLLDPAGYALNPLAVLSLLVAAAVAGLGLFALRRMERSSVSSAFLLVTLAIGQWLFSYAWVFAAIDEQVAFWWAKAGYIGVCLVPAAVSQYISTIVRDRDRTGKSLAAIFIVGGMFLALVLFTDIQFESLHRYSWGFYPSYGMTSIPLMLFFFGVMLESFHRLLDCYRNLPKGTAQTTAVRELLIGFVVGYGASIDFFVGFGISLYPIGYIPIFFFVVISTRSILRRHLTAITPAFAARQIIDTMNEGLIVLDGEGTIRVVNQAACGMLDCREQGLTDTRPTRSLNNNMPLARVMEELVRGEPVRNLELNYRRPGDQGDGTLILSASIMRDEDGAPLSVVCVLRDITSRKRAGEDLKQSVSLLKATLEATADGILVVDNGGRMVDFNTQFVELWRLPEDIVATRDDRRTREFVLDQLKKPEDFIDRVEELYANPGAESFDVLEFKDGRVFERYSKAQRIEEKAVGRVWSFRDVTRQKKLEEELLRSQKLESLGVLAGGIAHDFNNILTAILGNISLAKLQTDPDANQYRWLDDAEKASTRARDLTQQLLTFSKGGAPVKRVISLEQSLKDSTGFALRGANVRSDLRFADELWPVEADEGQMVQIFNNLLINACQAMPDGGEIRVSASNAVVDEDSRLYLPAGRYVKVTLEDQGTGIHHEHLHRIFDPYFTTKEQGNGLGLAVTYSIVKGHGGHIEVESRLDSGTVFTLYLPATDKAVKEWPVPEERRPACNGRVLLMDDEEMVREVGSAILMELGYTVETAVDGAAAIDACRRAKETGAPFHAVILDLTIPGGMGGKEAVRILKEMDPAVVAIVSSGYCNDPVMANYSDYGFNAVVSKPYRIAELGRALLQGKQ